MFNKKLVGFVVNILDPLNFQISLEQDFTAEVSTETYSYCDSNVPKDGITYKCRLYGLKMDRNNSKYSDTITLLNDRINIQNGWVICKLHHIDKYKRLILELFDPVTFENFGDLLVNNNTCVTRYT